MASLATVPPHIHYQFLKCISDFDDLSAAVRSARVLNNAFQTNRRRVLSSVGRNFLGSVFTDALLLARCQEKLEGSPALKIKGLSRGTVHLLMENAETIGELQTIMFGLLKDQSSVDLQKKNTMAQFAGAPPVVAASETESTRFRAAAYRFCVYCLFQTSEARKAFLKRYPKIQVLELSHFVSALWVLVSVIRGRPLETDRDWNFLSNIMSTGPHNVLELWRLKQDVLQVGYDWGDFKVELKAAGTRARKGEGGAEDEGEDEDNEDNEDKVDFMGEWCTLMDAHAPSPTEEGHNLAHLAILDAEHARLVEALALAAPREPSPESTHSDEDDEDEDDSDVGSKSDEDLGVVREDCLEDPFGE